MNSTRTRKAVSRTAVAATATALAALGLASVAWAGGGLVLDQNVAAKCMDPRDCTRQVPFTTTFGNSVAVDFAPNVSPDCPGLPKMSGVIDGNPVPLVLGTDTPLTNGNHVLTLNASCPGAIASWSWSGHVAIWAGGATPADQGPQGPTVKSDVQLFDQPGGKGNQIGQLNATDAVKLIGQCPLQNPNNPDDPNNGWCHVTDTTQGTTGWVWGDYIKQH